MPLTPESESHWAKLVSTPHPKNHSIQLDGKTLGTLCFDWVGDRYHHRWTFGHTDHEITSVESDSSVIWPVSPPLQQIHQQSFDDGREVIFGVGMSGRGHWSASFTLVPDLKCWIVELACRSPVAPETLMSSYRAATSQEPDAPTQFRFASNVTLEPISPSAIAERDSEQIRFLPAKMAEGNTATQWAFRLRVQPAA